MVVQITLPLVAQVAQAVAVMVVGMVRVAVVQPELGVLELLILEAVAVA